MARKILEQCPSCGGPLHITEVQCDRCETIVQARYRPCDFCALTEEQSTFLRIFVTSRGNLSEVEKRLGVSYPTVRAKLDEIIERLGTEEQRNTGRVDAPSGVGAAVRAAMPDIGPMVSTAVREAMEQAGPAIREAMRQASSAQRFTIDAEWDEQTSHRDEETEREQPSASQYSTRREVLDAIARGEVGAARGMEIIQQLGGETR